MSSPFHLKLPLSMLSLALGCAPLNAAELPPFKLGISTQVVATAFEFTPRDDAANKLKYRPAQSNYAGLTLGYRWIGGTLSFAVPASSEIRDMEGTSQYRDYRLSFYYRRFGIEASYNTFKGYLIENSEALSANTLNGQTYYKLPDLSTLGFGLSLIYVPDPDHYSLPAALEQSQIQQTTAGSWLLLATFRNQRISNSGAIIPTEKQSGFGSDATLRSIRMGSYAVGGGYGVNWVVGSFFLAPILAATLGYDQMNYDLDSSSLEHGKVGINLHSRIGAGWNSRSFFLAANFYVDIFGIQTDTIQVSNNIQGITFSLGARF